MKLAAAAAFALLSTLLTSAPAGAQRYHQVNLVSDLPGMALHTDSHLVNPWGLVPGGSGVFWASNNGSATSTLYDPDGTVRPLVVTIPGGLSTGIVATAPTDSSFRIPSADTTARALFIFVNQAGSVLAWAPTVNQTNAIQVANVPGASYTGAALGGPAATPHLYAANFHDGTIDVFDRDFHKVTLSGSFTDPNLPADYTPFNVANIGGQLFVAYAETADHQDETQGAGLGIVDVFDLNGNFIRRFVNAGGPLNAPWGMVAAPAGFGAFGGAMLVGNLGDGAINVFDSGSGASLGALQDSTGVQLSIPGLWGLHFGLPVSGAEVAGRLYFAAGIQDETHGLFGFLTPAAGGGVPVACDDEFKGIGFWRQLCARSDDSDDDKEPNGKAIGWHRNHDEGHGHGHGHGNGHGDDHGHEGGVSADSLDALFGCVRSTSSAFGSEGCFTASCDLLGKVGHRSERELVAQQLLTLRLNLCSGLVCDSVLVGCAEGEGSHVMTIGELADSLDVLLCNGASGKDLHAMAALMECESHGEDEDGEDEDGDRTFVRKIGVQTVGAVPAHLGADPIRLAVSTAVPSVVQLRIYDAAGRLVAEPMRNSLVSGTVEVRWDGRNMRGALVPPGNYFYRGTTGGEFSTGRIVIIR